MNKQNWNIEFPDVPENIHNVVLNTLADLKKQEEKKVKKIKKKTIIIIIAATVTLLGSVTAAASELFKWNQRAQESFPAEELLQDELVLDGNVTGVDQSVTNSGITINAIQTIQDENIFYGLFEITANNSEIKILPENSMDMTIEYENQNNFFSAVTWGFVDEVVQPEITNSRYYEIWANKSSKSIEENKIKIVFSSFKNSAEKAGIGEDLVTGNWEFDLNLAPAESEYFEVNKKCSLSGYDIFVKTVKLSPLSVEIVCTGEDITVMEKGEDISLEQLDSLYPMFVNGVKYEDGTVVVLEGYRGIEEGYDAATGNYRKSSCFSSVVDTDKIVSLLLGEDNSEITLR